VPKNGFNRDLRQQLLARVSLFAVSATFATTMAGGAFAQSAPAPTAAAPSDSQIVVIVGVRASILNSLKMKKTADSITDGVSAEDIGKFPDENVAESLQRIPGVSIDRSGGEGQFVSINGLGPDFADVLVNGRAIANDTPGRSFSFDTVASELVSGVQVYKTANANIPEGGIGGTIDVITAKPFDYKGFKFAGSVTGQYESLSKKYNPQASFLISNRFLDGKLGVLASYTHQERQSRTYQVDNSAIIHNEFYDTSAYAYVEDSHADAWRMQDLTRHVVDEKRTRDGGTLSLQYQASDDLKLSVDYLYTKFNVATTDNSASNWFWDVKDVPSNVRDSNGVYTTFDHGIGDNASGYAYNVTKTYRPTTTQLLGFNAAWHATDKLLATFDASWSQSINDNRGLNSSQTLEILNQPGFYVHMDGGVPYFDQNGNLVSQANEPLLRARVNSNSGNYIKSDNVESKLDFKYAASDAVHLDFGMAYTDEKKDNEDWSTPAAITRMYQKNAEGEQIDYNSIISGIYRPGDVFGNSKLNGDMFLINGDALRTWMASPAALAGRNKNATAGGLAEFIANGRTWTAVKNGDSFLIDEKVSAAYFDAHWDTNLFGKPLNLIAGVRYAQTNLVSSGTEQILTGFTDGGGGQLLKVYSGGLTSVALKHNYSNWLPSLNAKLELSSDMILRFAASQTLTRPTLEDMAPQLTYGGTSKTNRSATGNNPDLKPFVSTNYDLSYEWYYNKKGALALAVFHKDVQNFIVNVAQMEVIPTITDPTYATFNVTRPRNAKRATIDGINASFTYTLDNGFGLQTNYTKVESNASLDRTNFAETFAIPGLSDTANFVGFYEKGPWSARVAYNWRSEFLANLFYDGSTEPRYFAPYHQIDARVAFKIDDHTSVSLSGTNITDEKVKSHGRYDNEFLTWDNYGSRYMLTVSTKY